MPDAHWGYGFPIGGVAAFDAERAASSRPAAWDSTFRAASAACVTGLRAPSSMPRQAGARRRPVRGHSRPGVGSSGRIRLDDEAMNAMLAGGARWAVEQGYGERRIWSAIEEHGSHGRRRSGQRVRAGPETAARRDGHARLRQPLPRGAAGQRDPRRRGGRGSSGLLEGQIVVTIHCGSRGLGHQIGTEFLRSGLAGAGRRHRAARPRARLRAASTPSSGRPTSARCAPAINCALANRQILAHLTRRRVRAPLPRAAGSTAVRRLAQYLQGRSGTWSTASAGCCTCTARAPRAPSARAPGPARALPRGRPAGPHRRQHGHRLLHPRRHRRERGARVQLRLPRRRARHEPPARRPGRWRGASAGGRARSARHPDPQPVARAASPRRRRAPTRTSTAVVEGAQRAGLARRVARLEPLVCIKG